MKASDVYEGSDGEVTKAYYAELQRRGAIGVVAVNLFRAQKCSSRAKVYRGGIRGRGSYRRMAYDRKAWSMQELVKTLAEHAGALRIAYGWQQDPATVFGEAPSWVLYVDLPEGQVSFHSPARYAGPDYAGAWDGLRASASRIIDFCQAVSEGHHAPPDERQMTLDQIGAPQ